jgi:hypothetical protein
MGVFLVVGMMLYSVGMCLLFQRVSKRSPDLRYVERGEGRPALAVVVPDRVPAEWVDAYRAEQGL